MDPFWTTRSASNKSLLCIKLCQCGYYHLLSFRYECLLWENLVLEVSLCILPLSSQKLSELNSYCVLHYLHPPVVYDYLISMNVLLLYVLLSPVPFPIFIIAREQI